MVLRIFLADPNFEAGKGIPKNLSSQVLGGVRVNFWGGEFSLNPSFCE